MGFGQKEDKELQRRQERQIKTADENANRSRRQAAARRRARSGAGSSSALAFAGPVGLTDKMGAGGVRT